MLCNRLQPRFQSLRPCSGKSTHVLSKFQRSRNGLLGSRNQNRSSLPGSCAVRRNLSPKTSSAPIQTHVRRTITPVVLPLKVLSKFTRPEQTPSVTLSTPKSVYSTLTSQPAVSISSNHASLPQYRPPTTGLISYLPKQLIPYAELSRYDKPAGSIYLFFPCLFGSLFAASLTNPITPPLHLISNITLFFLGAVIMRGAGCTINDLWDRNLDPQVTRTRLRPIARRAVSVPAAITYTGVQLLAGLAILLQFPQPACLYYGVPSLLLVTTYPLAKRVTHYPQFVLGLTFSWGAIIGFPAFGIDLLAPENTHILAASALLYASCVSWTVLYDMIYACMDLRDDKAAGIKSIALRHDGQIKAVLSGLGVVQVALLASAGAMVGAGPLFYAGSCGGAAATLATMVWKVDLKDVDNCWWWFKYGCWFTGGAIATGMLGQYLVNRRSNNRNLLAIQA